MSIQQDEKGRIRPNDAMRKYLDWLLYNGESKPSNSISDGRWRAIIKFLKRNFDL